MGKNRGGRFADRPPNVEISTKGDTTYFFYVFPDGARKGIGNSKDSDAAYAQATALNGYFAQQRHSLDLAALIAPRARTMIESATNPRMSTLIQEFKRHDPKRRFYAEQTLETVDGFLRIYDARWRDKTVREMETTDFSAFLNELSDNSYVKHRPLLMRLMQFAGHQGYINANPVSVTLAKQAAPKVRRRHTWDGYKQILEFSGTPEWMRRAMRIALYSLQRREDVVMLHRVENNVDLKAGTITILQRKTRNYQNPVWIEIAMGDELRAAVEDCMRSEVPCPYLIHYRPAKLKASTRETKVHPFAVTPDHLTRTFADIRDLCGAYSDMPKAERPTIHELRALGIFLYEQAGYDREYIKALSGHATDAMLERYLRDHQQAGPRKVEAGMSGGQLPR